MNIFISDTEHFKFGFWSEVHSHTHTHKHQFIKKKIEKHFHRKNIVKYLDISSLINSFLCRVQFFKNFS